MNAIDVARKATAEGCMVFRPTKDRPGEYDVKPYFTGGHRGWIALDHFTASAIVTVYDALNEVNRERFGKLNLVKMASVAFKLIKPRGT